jgi:hypothetical protein
VKLSTSQGALHAPVRAMSPIAPKSNRDCDLPDGH